MKFKTLSRFLVIGLLLWIQACAGNPVAEFFEKPYFASPPAQLSKVDADIFENALSRQIYNRVPGAIKAWNQFIERHPRSFEAHNNLGLVYFEDDQVDQSILSFETALALEPSDEKIKTNLVKVLKFKSTLLKEAKNYNGAVDTLLRAQEISTGYRKERIGYIIEQYEDKVFEQAKQTNTLAAYEGFLQRFPNSEKNADEARTKIEGMKPVSADFMQSASSMEETRPAMDTAPAREKTQALMDEAEKAVKENGSGMNEAQETMNEAKEAMKAAEDGIEEPPEDEILIPVVVNDNDEISIPSMMGDKELPASDSETAASEAETVSEKMQKELSMLEDSSTMETGKSHMDESDSMEKNLTGDMQEMAKTLEEDSSATHVPEQPKEVAPSMEQQIEIATQPEPKPSSAPDLFPSPASQAPETTMEAIAQVQPSATKMVEITTFKDPLRVRNGPSLKSRVLATVAKGSQVPFIEEEDGWFHVEFSKGRMGWISKKYSRLLE